MLDASINHYYKYLGRGPRKRQGETRLAPLRNDNMVIGIGNSRLGKAPMSQQKKSLRGGDEIADLGITAAEIVPRLRWLVGYTFAFL